MTFNGNSVTVDGTDITGITLGSDDVSSLFSAENTVFVSWLLKLDLNEVVFSDNVTSINASFSNALGDITTLTLGSSLKEITNQSFSSCTTLSDVTILSMDAELSDSGIGFNSNSEPIENLTITGYEGSTAQTYAEANGFNFVVIPQSNNGNEAPETSETPANNVMLGDTDKNGTVDALDASLVLTAYALTATGESSGLDDEQSAASDVNSDGNIDALDASAILGYYAYTATGGKDSIKDFLSKN
jgi:hypothetical protein